MAIRASGLLLFLSFSHFSTHSYLSTFPPLALALFILHRVYLESWREDRVRGEVSLFYFYSPLFAHSLVSQKYKCMYIYVHIFFPFLFNIYMCMYICICVRWIETIDTCGGNIYRRAH